MLYVNNVDFDCPCQIFAEPLRAFTIRFELFSLPYQQVLIQMNEKSERPVYERWKKYHFANPDFYEQFQKFAREAMNTHAKIGARLICERMRWYDQVEKGSNLYRVCNSFAAYYVRLLMLDHPEFRSLFNTKSLKSGVTDPDIIRDVIEPSRDAASGDPDHSTGPSGPMAA